MRYFFCVCTRYCTAIVATVCSKFKTPTCAGAASEQLLISANRCIVYWATATATRPPSHHTRTHTHTHTHTHCELDYGVTRVCVLPLIRALCQLLHYKHTNTNVSILFIRYIGVLTTFRPYLSIN